jgi:SlyX protein|tara:strand:+ start:184 stop:390 length:207 start_codon:yes stop_codon:yes gene_type:complete
MKNLIKKLEEQVAFLQHENSQMSDELYSQQKEVSVLKNKISNFEKRINDLENDNETAMVMEDKKPPHY